MQNYEIPQEDRRKGSECVYVLKVERGLESSARELSLSFQEVIHKNKGKRIKKWEQKQVI